MSGSRYELHAVSMALPKQTLEEAFGSFRRAAASLESSYAELQGEVARLRRELEETNCSLVQSLEENQKTRQRLAQILEGLPCGVLVVEPGGAISVTNPEARRILAVASPDFSANLTPPFDGTLVETGRECHLGRGEVEWVSLRRAELDRESGGHSVFILQDITGLKRLGAAHETARRRHALAEMSALLAHEIRNPLGSLELFAGLLAQSRITPEQRDWIEHLQAGLRTLSATVNNVLRFHSEWNPGNAETELGELLEAVECFLAPQARQAGIQVEVRPPLHALHVRVDRQQAQQVLLNLALNAFRAMPQGGKLRILTEASETAGMVQIQVIDNGIGITPEALDRIFEPGYTTRCGSPGLGLAVCKLIVEQHQGAIRVASRPGMGTHFVIELPLGRNAE